MELKFEYDTEKFYNDVVNKVAYEMKSTFITLLRHNPSNGTSGDEIFKNQVVNRLAKEIAKEIKKEDYYQESIDRAIVKGVNKSLGLLIQKTLREE